MSSWTRSVLIAIAAADPSPAAVITCARGLLAFPAAQTPETLVWPVGSTRTKPSSPTSQPSDSISPSSCGCSDGRMKIAARGMTRPSLSSTACRRSSATERRHDGSLDHRDASGVECCALLAGERVRVGEEDDVVRPLPQELRVLDGAGIGSEHADRLVAHLPAMAVGAVEEVAAPALPRAGNLGKLVDGAGREQQPSRCHRAAPGKREREARLRSRRPRPR